MGLQVKPGMARGFFPVGAKFLSRYLPGAYFLPMPNWTVWYLVWFRPNINAPRAYCGSFRKCVLHLDIYVYQTFFQVVRIPFPFYIGLEACLSQTEAVLRPKENNTLRLDGWSMWRGMGIGSMLLLALVKIILGADNIIPNVARGFTKSWNSHLNGATTPLEWWLDPLLWCCLLFEYIQVRGGILDSEAPIREWNRGFLERWNDFF